MHEQTLKSHPRPSAIRVALHAYAPLLSFGLRAMLEGQSRVTLVDFEVFLAGLEEVDLLLLDPEPVPGHRVSPRIFSDLGTAIVLFTWPGFDADEMAAIPGVVGHVPKSASAAELVRMLEALSSSKNLAEWCEGDLGDREAQILALIARGFTNHEVADRLLLSVNTVKTYIRSAYAKIGVETRSQATAWTLRNYN